MSTSRWDQAVCLGGFSYSGHCFIDWTGRVIALDMMVAASTVTDAVVAGKLLQLQWLRSPFLLHQAPQQL